MNEPTRLREDRDFQRDTGVDLDDIELLLDGYRSVAPKRALKLLDGDG